MGLTGADAGTLEPDFFALPESSALNLPGRIAWNTDASCSARPPLPLFARPDRTMGQFSVGTDYKSDSM